MNPEQDAGGSGPQGWRVAVGPISGYIFSGEDRDIPCFVPESMVTFDAAGQAVIDQVHYTSTGWSQRNARASDSETGGSHVFPDGRKLLDPRAVPNLRAKVERWRRLDGAGAAARDQA